MSFQSKYEYKSIDNSLLTPAFKKYIVVPCSAYMPLSVHPNLITVFSFFFSVLALTLSYLYPLTWWAHFFIGILILLYLIGDHLDGMQAKRRGGGTPLGEFLDHFLDVITNGILLVILANCFEVNDLRVLFFMFFCSYVMQSFIFYEHYYTGWVVFGPFGAFEAVFSGIFFVIFSCIDPIYTIGNHVVYGGLRVFDIMLTLISISGLSILYNISQRIGKNGIKEISLLLISIALIMALTLYFDLSVLIHIAIGLTAVFTIQEYMVARLTFNRNRWVDFIPILCFIFLIPFGLDWVFYSLMATLIVVRFFWTIKILTRTNTQ